MITRRINSAQISLLLVIVSLISAYGFSSIVRFNQYQAWERALDEHFVGTSPMMTTLDSYYWIRWADLHRDGIPIPENDSLRFFPEGASGPNNIPLLSLLISTASPLFGGDLYRSGFFLCIAFAGLFVFPLGIYFYRIGLPSLGLLGGLVGSVSYEYLVRTEIGRVDTDSLMLFWFFLIALFIYTAAYSKNFLIMMAATVTAAISTFLLYLWWGSDAYTIPLGLTLLVALIFGTKDLSRTSTIPKALKLLTAFAVFLVVASGLDWSSILDMPSTMAYYLSNYVDFFSELTTESSSGAVSLNSYPNIYETITEKQQLNFGRALRGTLLSPWLSGLGIFGFSLLAIRQWRRLIPLFPIFVLGLLSFQGARRFGIFLGPFVGIGWAYLILLVIGYGKRLGGNRSRRNLETESQLTKQTKASDHVLSYVLATVFFVAISSKTAIGRIPEPVLPTPTFWAFKELDNKLATNGIIYSWWDYGYAITANLKRATFHDGGTQFSRNTYIIARSMTSDENSAIYQALKLINDFTPDAKTAAKGPGDRPIYLLFTKDLINKFKTIYSVGEWNPKTEKFAARKGYKRLPCANYRDHLLFCDDKKIDLRSVSHFGTERLSGVWVSDSGYGNAINTEREDSGKYLQIHRSGDKFLGAYLLDEAVFESNFNQMYLLGQFDHDLFEETYNAFPWVRAFKVLDGSNLMEEAIGIE